jgi:putative DNA primase/helicase
MPSVRGRDFNDVLLEDGPEGVLKALDVEPFVDGVVVDPAAEAEAIRKFGLAELNEAIAVIKSAEGDARALLLHASSQSIGSLAAAGALHEGFARAAIEDAAAACGLIRDDGVRAIRKVIADGIKLGKKRPRDLSDVSRDGSDGQKAEPRYNREQWAKARASGKLHPDDDEASKVAAGVVASPAPVAPTDDGGTAGEPQPPNAPEDNSALNMRLAFFPLTDLGNAERFRERHRCRLLWCEAIGWLAWDGKRWGRAGADDLVRLAEHVTVRLIQYEAAEVRESGRLDIADPKPGARDFVAEVKKDQSVVLYSEKIARWGRTSEAINKLNALSKLGAPYLAVGVEKLDADKMKINVNNGTLVVARKRDGEDYISFQPHDPADLITKISPVDYVPTAICVEYDKFIARIQPLEAMRVFIHQWLGLSLTGDVSEQKLAYFYGSGSNGKSVLMDTVSYIAGDYGETVPIETFLDHGKSRSGGQATPDLAILPGVRMLRTSEPEKNSKLAEATVKLVTGGEPIQARHLNRDFFKFYPQFKLTISGNHRPRISGADEGIWRRFRLVPFEVSIKKEERDLQLAEKLRAEASGILNRLLDGLRHWCDNGLVEPEAVTAATDEYRSISDPLSRFLSTCVEKSLGGRVQSSMLYAVFEAWCKSSGETVWKQKGFSMAMDERGFKRMHSDGVWFLDIKLLRYVHDFVDVDGRPVAPIQDGNREDPNGADVEF